MTLFELDTPRQSLTSGMLSRIGQSLGNGMRAVQYGRMMQALSNLSDETLAEIGIERSNIPAHARACIYDTE